MNYGIESVSLCQVISFNHEVKYVFTGIICMANRKDIPFAKRMDLPEAIDFFSNYLYSDTSITTITTKCEPKFYERLLIESDFAFVSIECKTDGVITKIDKELRKVKNQVVC